MTTPRTPALRSAAAAGLRSMAERLAPPPLPAAQQGFVPPPSPALLVRVGGRWWYRHELYATPRSEVADVQLLP